MTKDFGDSTSLEEATIFGLPVGISFIGRTFSEPTLIRLAYAFEQATQARHAPQYRPTLLLIL
jgi:amidase